MVRWKGEGGLGGQATGRWGGRVNGTGGGVVRRRTVVRGIRRVRWTLAHRYLPVGVAVFHRASRLSFRAHAL